jgi:hypothetical protein
MKTDQFYGLRQLGSTSLQGVPDFEYPHIKTIDGPRKCLACSCGATIQICGLAWLSWMEEHRTCSNHASAGDDTESLLACSAP